MYALKKDDVLQKLQTTRSGLTDAQIEQRRQTFGKNEIVAKKKETIVHKFFMQFKNVMVIILLISAIISLSLAIYKKEYNDLFEGFVILFIVFLNATIGVIQEVKAEDAIGKLNQSMELKARVYRNGVLVKLPNSELVVGDIVVLQSGDVIPADIRLLETHSLKCNESSITGESEQVLKNENVVLPSNALINERKNMAFRGAVVTYGHGLGVVTAVGQHSEMGKIASMLEDHVKRQTPLEKSIAKIGRIASFAVLFISVIIFFMQLLVNKNMDILHAFMVSVALAVAAIPESLPAIITIIMALGVQKLAKQRAIVRKLSAVETLGSCTCIASDKTGTITQNKLRIQKIYTSQNVFDVRAPQEQSMNALVTFLALCNNVEESQGSFLGNQVDIACAEWAIEQGATLEKVRVMYPRVDEIPFDSKRKSMVTVHKGADGYVAIEKGAYDYLLNRCDSVILNGKVQKLTHALRMQIHEANSALAKEALRVIGVAFKESKQEHMDTSDGFTFLALVGMIDPPRPEVKQAIVTCKRAGMRPIMITGDHKDTALAIAREVGIAHNENEVITGEQLASMDDATLRNKIQKISVFARVVPEHKVRIVKALQSLGHVVAMTGDGVNDAPSIKKADIGVGMGVGGSDVTKMVADVVLADDNFASIVVAVEEGRKVYANIGKAVQFLLSTNAVEVLAMLFCVLLYPLGVFLYPAQILFINLVTDSLPAFALGLEKGDPHLIEQPPRKVGSHVLSGVLGWSIVYQSIVQTVIVLSVFVFGMKYFGNEVASTMAFYTIIYMQWLHCLNVRSQQSVFDQKPFQNKVFTLCFLLTFGLNMLVTVFPMMRMLFGLETLHANQWLTVMIASVSVIPVVEIIKAITNAYLNRKQILGKKAWHKA